METTWRTPDGLAVFVFRRSPGALILAVLAVGEAGLGHKAGLEPGETEMFTWLAAMPLCHQVFEKMLSTNRGVSKAGGLKGSIGVVPKSSASGAS